MVVGMPLVFSMMRQVILYLKTGAWVKFSGADALAVVFTDSAWLYDPQDWIGVHKFLEWIHGGILATAILTAMYLPIVVLIELAKDRISKNA